MTLPRVRIELLADHARGDFDCGVEPLNDYFRKQADQDARRRVSFCYVAVDAERGDVAGYYTLAATGIALAALPEAAVKRLPRYPTVPAVLIGRLALDRRYQGRGLGAALLFDAIARAVRAEIAAFAVIVDAKDEAAVGFYERFKFRRFGDDARRLFLPIKEGLKRLASGEE